MITNYWLPWNRKILWPSLKRLFAYTSTAVIDSMEHGEYSARIYRGSGIGFGKASVLPGDTVEMTVFTSNNFPGTCMLEGRVLEPTGREPVENAVVTSSAGRQITTDAEDSFVMHNHPAGDYCLTIGRVSVVDSMFYSFSPDSCLSDTLFLGSGELTPVTKGLIAYYPLNWSAVDLGPHSLNGTMVGATAGTDRNGRSKGAIAFDGTSYVEIPHAAWQQTNPMSASFWLKVPPLTMNPLSSSSASTSTRLVRHGLSSLRTTSSVLATSEHNSATGHE